MLNRVIPDGKKEVLWDEAGNYRSHPAGVAHFFLVYLAVLVGFTFAFLAVTVSRLAGWNDSLAEQLVGEPFWLPNILAGACFGAFFYKRIRHRFAFWSWVPSCILLIWSAWDWHGAIGPRDRRAPMFDFAWSAMQPNDLGMDEYMELCRIIGVEPYVTVNAGLGDAIVEPEVFVPS